MRDPRTHDIVDCAVQIHKRLGPGLLERAYRDILSHEVRRRGHRVDREVVLDLRWDHQLISRGVYRCDLVVDQQVIVEVKATVDHHPIYVRQVLTYLECTGLGVGLLLNFGGLHMRDGIHRVVR